uniref:Uncharacterized protein n=1 Tax=Latimeria chalumnae TaxID=7897 RepID=H3B678_LATCH
SEGCCSERNKEERAQQECMRSSSEDATSTNGSDRQSCSIENGKEDMKAILKEENTRATGSSSEEESSLSILEDIDGSSLDDYNESNSDISDLDEEKETKDHFRQGKNESKSRFGCPEDEGDLSDRGLEGGDKPEDRCSRKANVTMETGSEGKGSEHSDTEEVEEQIETSCEEKKKKDEQEFTSDVENSDVHSSAAESHSVDNTAKEEQSGETEPLQDRENKLTLEDQFESLQAEPESITVPLAEEEKCEESEDSLGKESESNSESYNEDQENIECSEEKMDEHINEDNQKRTNEALELKEAANSENLLGNDAETPLEEDKDSQEVEAKPQKDHVPETENIEEEDTNLDAPESEMGKEAENILQTTEVKEIISEKEQVVELPTGESAIDDQSANSNPEHEPLQGSE